VVLTFYCIRRPDGEDSGKCELQFLARHGLQRHRKVEGRDADLPHLLERIDHAFLGDLDSIDTNAGDGEVGVRLRDVIARHDGDFGCGSLVR
jgi:hypothetical protein